MNIAGIAGRRCEWRPGRLLHLLASIGAGVLAASAAPSASADTTYELMGSVTSPAPADLTMFLTLHDYTLGSPLDASNFISLSLTASDLAGTVDFDSTGLVDIAGMIGPTTDVTLDATNAEFDFSFSLVADSFSADLECLSGLPCICPPSGCLKGTTGEDLKGTAPFNFFAVPEPRIWALLLAALGALLGARILREWRKEGGRFGVRGALITTA